MNNKPKLVIPIDNAIDEFDSHLKSHPRTIFSSKFGDGKTYFLKEFIKERKGRYLFITLHPINYQVLENRDIFDLIKRDVLFQITVNGLLSEDLNIDDKAALAFYVQNNFMCFTESVLSTINQLHSSTEVAKGVLIALSTNKLLKELKKKVSEQKKKYKTIDALEEYFEKTNTIPVLEEDIITKIIHDSIDEYKKKHPRKRIVLLIEDMDRLDPAHLFRIMNVISAHLDTNEKYFIKSNNKYFYNKFHFDNIVFVMDYNNTRKIFEHFYGINTNFEGYIQKFVSKGLFKYSLEEERFKFIQSTIVELTSLPSKYVETIISKDVLVGKNLRVISDSFDNIDSQIKEFPVYKNKKIHIGLLRLIVILRRIELDENLLVSAYWDLDKEHKDEIEPYVINYLAIRLGEKGDSFYCKGVYEADKLLGIKLGDFNTEKQLFNSEISNQSQLSSEAPKIDFADWLKALKKYVSE